MRTMLDKEIHQAFVLSSSDLQRIYRILEAAVKKVDLDVECIDGTTLKTSSIDEILSYTNPPHRRITQIWLKNYGGEGQFDKISVRLQNTPHSGPIIIAIEGEDAAVMQLYQQLSDVITTICPWFSPVATLSIGWQAFLFGLAVWAGVCLIGASVAIATDRVSLGRVEVLLIVTAILYIIAFAWRDTAFPRGSFLIGHGEARFRSLEAAHRYIGIGIFSALIVGLLANYIFGRLFN